MSIGLSSDWNDLNVAGIDEVGRGCIAGPVFAAAVMLERDHAIGGIRDSKKLTAKRRLQLALEIKRKSSWALGMASVAEIDQLNILQASLLAMKRALEHLPCQVKLAVFDGCYCPDVHVKAYSLVKGDQHLPAISAASIIAKVARDEQMQCFDKHYPQYGFAQHKGYPTAQHIAALREYGVCAIHRKGFAPVKACQSG